jgi:hypothetical protein
MDAAEIWSELDTTGLGQGSVEDSCQHGSEVSLSEMQLSTPQEGPCTTEL